MQLGELLLKNLLSVSEQAIKQLTPNQYKTLVKKFQAKPYLGQGEKSHLAKLLNISEIKITRWFHRRRYINQKMGLLRKYKHPK